MIAARRPRGSGRRAVKGTLLSAIALMYGCPTPVLADGLLEDALGVPEGWTIKGGIRSRMEAIDGQFRPGRPESDMMLSLKTTLMVEYDADAVRIGGELWDGRAYGQDRNSSANTSEVNAMEMVQLYVGFDVRTGAQGKARVTAGRYTLNLGSRRLVARQAFRNTTNAHTGVNFIWNDGKGDQLAGFWSMPQIRLPDDAEGILHNKVEWDDTTADLQFYGLHFTKNAVLDGVLELYAIGLGERDGRHGETRNRHLYTPGARLYRQPRAGQFDHDIEAAYQFGRARASADPTDRIDQDVSAYFAHAGIGYTWQKSWNPRLSLDFDIASGDKAGSKNYNRFDTLYGARRFEFGPTSLYGAVGRFNVISGGVRGEIKPGVSSELSAMYRALWLQSKTDSFSGTGVADASGSSGRFAGHQVEMRYRRTIVPDVLHFDTGVAYLAKGRFLKTAPNAPQTGDASYAYFDLYFDF